MASSLLFAVMSSNRSEVLSSIQHFCCMNRNQFLWFQPLATRASPNTLIRTETQAENRSDEPLSEAGGVRLPAKREGRGDWNLTPHHSHHPTTATRWNKLKLVFFRVCSFTTTGENSHLVTHWLIKLFFVKYFVLLCFERNLALGGMIRADWLLRTDKLVQVIAPLKLRSEEECEVNPCKT